MKTKYLTHLLAATFISCSINAYALPPQAEANKLMIEAKAAMDAQNYKTAAENFARVAELKAKVPDTFAYHYGVALANTYKYELALQQLEKYITKAGEGGKFYKEALELYSKVEKRLKLIIPKMIAIPAGGGLAAFELGETEVTQAQWQAIMGSNPSYFKGCGEDCPVEQVSWDDVQVYLQKLNAKTGQNYRLPTEKEWFYACQAGRTTEYCGGNNLDAVAWYDGNNGGKTHPVKGKQANGWGLYDMSGNVWEWQSDCWRWEGNCEKRTLRGGSWFQNDAKFPLGQLPQKRTFVDSGGLGFRVARTAP